MAFVPEGQHARSQARSAWKRPSNEPPRRVRYDQLLALQECAALFGALTNFS
jgi:hypothetical protein